MKCFECQRSIQIEGSVSHKKREEVGLKHLKDPKTFPEYSNDMKDVRNSIKEYNPGKERKVLIVFTDVISNKKLHTVATELFIRGKKINIFLVFIAQSYCFLYRKT